MALLLLKAAGEAISVKYADIFFFSLLVKTCNIHIFKNSVNGKWGSLIRNCDPVTRANPF